MRVAPDSPLNHYVFAVASQRKQLLGEAGTAYLSAMRRGMEGSSDQIVLATPPH